jgi:hypothetical protein
LCILQLGKVEPPEETGMWGLGEWDQTEMENPWRFAKNKKMAPFDEKVGGQSYKTINLKKTI